MHITRTYVPYIRRYVYIGTIRVIRAATACAKFPNYCQEVLKKLEDFVGRCMVSKVPKSKEDVNLLLTSHIHLTEDTTV